MRIVVVILACLALSAGASVSELRVALDKDVGEAVADASERMTRLTVAVQLTLKDRREMRASHRSMFCFTARNKFQKIMGPRFGSGKTFTVFLDAFMTVCQANTNPAVTDFTDCQTKSSSALKTALAVRSGSVAVGASEAALTEECKAVVAFNNQILGRIAALRADLLALNDAWPAISEKYTAEVHAIVVGANPSVAKPAEAEKAAAAKIEAVVSDIHLSKLVNTRFIKHAKVLLASRRDSELKALDAKFPSALRRFFSSSRSISAGEPKPTSKSKRWSFFG